MDPEEPRARYFIPHPACNCGKPSGGILRSFTNENLGNFCKACGRRHVREGVAFQKTEAGQDMVRNCR